MDWTDEAVAKLKEMVQAGHPYSVIGRTLGCSRNAAIGKAKRVGVGGNLSPAEQAKRRASVARSYAPKVERKAPPKKKRPAFPQPEGPVVILEELPPIPMHERKGILDLANADCRWPIGDPDHKDFHFCARTRLPGSSYCPHHHNRACPPSAQQAPRDVYYHRRTVRAA